MAGSRSDTADLLADLRRAQAGRDFEAAERIAEGMCLRNPAQDDAVGFLVGRALARKDPARALAIARGGVQANAASARLQFQFGLALGATGQWESASRAFAQAQALDPELLAAPLWQADCELALGRDEAALRCRLRALDIAERKGLLAREAAFAAPVRERVARAVEAVQAARREAIEGKLAPLRASLGAAPFARIDRALERLHGGAAPTPTHPLQRPSLLFVPGLPDQAWFEREQFPFLRALEASTPVIREELLRVLADESVLAPYIDMPDAAPAAPIWRALNRSPAWSAFHLYRHGERVEANAARCPRTMAVLDSLPLMRIADHAPEILFSVLAPRTHIPPHTGVINGRLTVHLPLIVPTDCGALRVGDKHRPWKEGECLIFDDSFVHEAWNASDSTRVVLILDTWNPHLMPPERDALGAAIAEMGRFNRRNGSQLVREST